MGYLKGLTTITATDSYKVGQAPQYPKGTTEVYSYFESRKGALFQEMVFFGLLPILKVLEKPVTMQDIDDAEVLFMKHFGVNMFNRAGWENIVNRYSGRLPIKIKAVPEGMVVPVGNVLMTVKNTDGATDTPSYWLTNYLETVLTHVWYPSTVATNSREMKKLILEQLHKTGTPELIDFKLHDFGFRGVTCNEQAAIGGLAHLVNFKGTDTMAALILAAELYKCECAGYSIAASEHSTITSWGQENEVDAMRNMIKTYGDNNLYACVSDSYDIYRACRQLWGKELKAEVLAAKGTLVIRPDSGEPTEVVVKCLDILGEAFGFTYIKGYKVLNPKVRLIQGDGIDFEEVRRIQNAMERAGWSADNIAYGSGGGLLQKLNRDTMRCAFKCSSVTVNGFERDVSKAPVTDAGKTSKKGKLSLVMKNGVPTTVKGEDREGDLLETVFLNGDILKEYTLDEVRANAAKGLRL
jgi:nicotinamide phosphoribosyltransferase